MLTSTTLFSIAKITSIANTYGSTIILDINAVCPNVAHGIVNTRDFRFPAVVTVSFESNIANALVIVNAKFVNALGIAMAVV